MGRLIPRKRPDFLVDVFNKVHKSNPNTALLVFGEGPLKNQIVEKIEKYNIKDSVFLLGTTFGEEKIRFYNSSDVFIFPSINEGFVLVILEALAAGLPIVASKAVSFSESVQEGRNGFLVDPYNEKEWEKKMTELITGSMLRKKFAIKSRSIAVKKFSWKQTAANNLKYYNSLINDK